MPFITDPSTGNILEFHEVPKGSPVLQQQHGQSRVERTFIIDGGASCWANYESFVRGMLGYPVIKNVNANAPLYQTYVSRVLPDSMPFTSPSTSTPDPWLWAQSVVHAEGMGPTEQEDANGMAIYKKIKVTLSYEPLSYKIETDDQMLADLAYIKTTTSQANILALPNNVVHEGIMHRYVTQTRKPSAEFLQLPRGLMYWVGLSNLKCDFATAVLLPTLELNWTWHQVPFVPDAARKYVGKLNLYPFTAKYIDGTQFTFAAGTLLVLAAEIKPYRLATGAFVQDIVYRIKYMDIDQPGSDSTHTDLGYGHNFFLKYKANSFTGLARLKLTDNGNNDALAIQGCGIVGHPYSTTVAAGNGNALYSYVDFFDLFRFKATS